MGNGLSSSPKVQPVADKQQAGTSKAPQPNGAIKPTRIGESDEVLVLTPEASEGLLSGVPMLPINKNAKLRAGKQGHMPDILENLDSARGKSGNPLKREGLSRADTRPDLPDNGDRSPEEVMQELLKGNMRFISGDSIHPHQDLARLQAIKKEQKPICAVLGCADSRVPSEIIFDLGFGDMFNCRVAGNVATTEEIASLEYGVLACNVKVVMVLGHTSCGAVKAAIGGKSLPGFLDTLLEHINMSIVMAQINNAHNFRELEALQRSLKEAGGHPDPRLLDLIIRENVKYQMQRVKRSTIILQAIVEGRCKLVGCVYDLKTGEVEVIQE